MFKLKSFAREVTSDMKIAKFDPSADGFRKFMDPVEETVLRYLWSIGAVGATRDQIVKDTLSSSKKKDISERGVLLALRKLRDKGLIEPSVVRKSPPITIYRSTMNENETRYFLVSNMCSIIKKSMPAEYEEAKRRLGLED